MDVILLEPEISGNVGAVTRIMANFGFEKLVLISPKCDHLCEESRRRAKHAQKILENAEVSHLSVLHTYDTLIATTAQVGTYYNIPRAPLTPDMLPPLFGRKVGILFGRESSGLSNEEILLCDFVVTIPSIRDYPTLNISHAVAIVLYEAAKKKEQEKAGEHIEFASKDEKNIILMLVDEILESLSFATNEKRETQRKVWKRILGKSFMTKREAFAMIGFLKKIRR